MSTNAEQYAALKNKMQYNFVLKYFQIKIWNNISVLFKSQSLLQIFLHLNANIAIYKVAE